MGEENNATVGANENLEGQKQVKTYTQEEVDKLLQVEGDKRVTEAIKTNRAKWEAEYKEKLENERKEAERLAQLSAEEKEKELQARKDKELADTKAELARVYLEKDTIDRLNEEGLPLEFKSFLMQENADTTNANIKTFKTVFEDIVAKRVQEEVEVLPACAGVII